VESNSDSENDLEIESLNEYDLELIKFCSQLQPETTLDDLRDLCPAATAYEEAETLHTPEGLTTALGVACAAVKEENKNITFLVTAYPHCRSLLPWRGGFT